MTTMVDELSFFLTLKRVEGGESDSILILIDMHSLCWLPIGQSPLVETWSMAWVWLGNAKYTSSLVNGIEALVLLDKDPPALYACETQCLCAILEREREIEKRGIFHEITLKQLKKSIVCVSQVNWLILPVIIFLDQRLSHACPRLNKLSVNLRMAH